MSKKPTTEYIDQEDYIDSVTGEVVEADLEVIPWEESMQHLADNTGHGRITIPRNKEFNRKQVVNAFQNAFDLIGGTPRLALWAHKNEKEFYKLYARLLPSQSSSALGEANELVVKHILPKGPLDG